MKPHIDAGGVNAGKRGQYISSTLSPRDINDTRTYLNSLVAALPRAMKEAK